MKKILLLPVFLFFFSILSFSQNDWGITAGYARTYTNNFNQGKYIGSPVVEGFYRHAIFPNFYLKMSLGFISTGYKLDNITFTNGYTGYVKQRINYVRYVLTPFYFKKSINKNVAVAAGIGTYVAYGINGFTKTDEGTVSKNKIDFRKNDMQRNDVGGLNGEVSIELKKHFTIQAFYSKGFTRISSYTKSTNKAIGLTVGYVF